MLENFTHNIRKSWFIWVWARLNQHVLIKRTHISHLSAFSFYVSLLFLVSKKQLIINSSLYNNSSIPLGTKQYDPAVIGRLTQNYNWEISGIFWSDSRPGAPLLWPDHNNNETFKIEFIHKKLTYTCRVSPWKKNAKHNFFCSNPETYLLCSCTILKKIYNQTTNSITSSLLIPRDNGRRQFFLSRHYDYFLWRSLIRFDSLRTHALFSTLLGCNGRIPHLQWYHAHDGHFCICEQGVIRLFRQFNKITRLYKIQLSVKFISSYYYSGESSLGHDRQHYKLTFPIQPYSLHVPPLHTNRRPQPRNHTIVFFDRQKGQTTHFTIILD